MRFKARGVLLALVAVFSVSAVAVTSAWAASSPGVQTNPASAVTGTGATLNGIVDPHEAATKYYFEYGTTESYGSRTVEASAGSGGEFVAEIKSVSGLTANTTYYFRVAATNSGGTSYGSAREFHSAGGAVPEFKTVPTKKKFTMSGGVVEIANLPYEPVRCAKSSATGEITGIRTVGNVVVTYSGCAVAPEEECFVNSVGAKAGEIVSKALTGELGAVATSQAASGVGLLLGKTYESRTKWFTIEHNKCGMFESVASGSLAAEVGVIKKKQTTNTLTFAAGEKGQKIKTITLDSGPLEKPELESAGLVVGLDSTGTLTFEEPVEVT
jgi:hypothetical protein